MEDRFKHMKALQPSAANFSGILQKAVLAIQARINPVLAIALSDRDKSVLLLLPIWVEPGGITIIVVPSITQYQDIQWRCDELCILCAAWTSSMDLPCNASIVLVTLDLAMSDAVGMFIDRLEKARRLDRIVIDECEQLLGVLPNFRRKSRALAMLRRCGVQIVMVSAILSSNQEEILWRKMGWMSKEVAVFRREEEDAALGDYHENMLRTC